MPAIEIKNISKRYTSATCALANVDLDIRPGERLALLGCSGAGKTTLLRIIAGLETTDSGTVLFDGRDAALLRPADRSLAMVSQDFALYPQLSIWQNLDTALQRSGLSRANRNARIHSTLDWFRVGHLLHQLPNQVSGGEAQRAAFAKAMVTHPQTLLLDEPFSQIDAILKEPLMDLVVQSTRQFKLTTIIVTHSPLDAMRIADRIAILHGGKILDVGSALDLYRKPKTRIAGNLLSPFGMNWFEPTDLQRYAVLENQPFPSRLKKFAGFRPEDVELCSFHENPTASDGLLLPLGNPVVQDLGFAKLLTGEFAGTPLLALVPPALALPQPDVGVFVPWEKLVWADE